MPRVDDPLPFGVGHGLESVIILVVEWIASSHSIMLGVDDRAVEHWLESGYRQVLEIVSRREYGGSVGCPLIGVDISTGIGVSIDPLENIDVLVSCGDDLAVIRFERCAVPDESRRFIDLEE